VIKSKDSNCSFTPKIWNKKKLSKKVKE